MTALSDSDGAKSSRSDCDVDNDVATLTAGEGSGRSLNNGVFSHQSTPQQLGRFAVLRPVGAGAMGTVYACYDEVLDRRVAIKVLNATEATAHRRVLREAKAMAQLSHPHVVQVFEVGTEEGRDFIAMEYIDGPSLDAWQADAVHPWRELVAVYRQAGEGLAAAHVAGIVHRDFKPHNVLLGGSEEAPVAKVADFGIARNDELVDSADLDGGRIAALGRLGETVGPKGSPAYMAPEQFTDGTITAAADQYAFCVALWEALYGRRPFQADGVASQLQLALEGCPHDPPAGSRVPAWLRSALVRGLAPQPADRHASMTDLLDALDRDPARHRRRWVAGLGAAVTAGALVWSWPTPEQPCKGAEAKLAEVWNDARRETAGQAILATGAPYAKTTWTSIRTALDAYGDEWIAMHTDACEATSIRREQSSESLDLRMECLHRAHVQLDIVAGILEQTDEAIVEEAGDLVSVLPPIDECGDVARLRAERVPPRPEDAATVDALRTKVARARAEIQIGQYEDGEALLTEARTESAELDYPPLLTEIDLELAFVYRPLSRLPESVEAYRRALRSSAASLDGRSMFDAATGLAYVIGHAQGDADAAEHYLDLAEGDDERRSSLLRIRGLLADRRMKLEEAEVFHREALELYRGLPHGDPKILGRLLVGNANVLTRLGRFDEARASFDEALDVFRSNLGESHPHTITVKANLGSMLAQSKHPDAARDTLEDVLAAQREIYGPRSRFVAFTEINLAQIYGELGEHERSLEHAVAAKEIIVELMGPRSPGIANIEDLIADSLRALNRLEEAETHYRRALEQYADEDSPPGAGRATLSWFGLGWTLQSLGRGTEAEAAFRRALELASDDRARARVRVGLGTTLLELGRFDEALPVLEEAHAVLTPEDGPLYFLNALSLAKTTWAASTDPSDRTRAVELATVAVSVPPGAEGERIVEQAKAWLRQHRHAPTE